MLCLHNGPFDLAKNHDLLFCALMDVTNILVSEVVKMHLVSIMFLPPKVHHADDRKNDETSCSCTHLEQSAADLIAFNDRMFLRRL